MLIFDVCMRHFIEEFRLHFYHPLLVPIIHLSAPLLVPDMYNPCKSNSFYYFSVFHSHIPFVIIILHLHLSPTQSPPLYPILRHIWLQGELLHACKFGTLSSVKHKKNVWWIWVSKRRYLHTFRPNHTATYSKFSNNNVWRLFRFWGMILGHN